MASVREMTNTLLRAARSAVISSARDFSCCIVTGNDELTCAGRGPAGAYLRLPHPGCQHAPLPRRRHPPRRCLSRQRSVRRQHASRRSHLHGAGVLGRRALVHQRGEMPHGRYRQLHSQQLLRACPRRLSRRRSGVPGRAHPARPEEHRGHHAHVPRTHPRAGPVVRRLPRRPRRGARGGAAFRGTMRQIRRRNSESIRARLA